MIILAILNLIAAYSVFLLVTRFFCLSSAVDNLIAFFIVFMAQVVLSELILGMTGILYLPSLLLINAVFLSIIWVSTKRRSPIRILPDMSGFLNEIKNDKIICFVIAILLSFALIKIIKNLVNPPLGWDDLNYHFTFAVEWLKHGNLDTPITIFDDPSPSYYPINGSLVFLWFMLPLKNVFLADLGQVPFFALAFLSVYSLAIKLSLNKRHSFLAASLFTLIPNYFKQLQIAYVDVMVAALFLASLNWLFLLNRDFRHKNIILYSLSLGLLAGTKTVALPYALLLFIPFIWFSFHSRMRSLKYLPTSLIIIIAFGGFSYLRNLFQTANPLFPLDMSLGSWHIFKGVMDAATYRAHFLKSDYSLEKILFHEGLGVQAAVFILPSIFLALPLAMKKRIRLDWLKVYLFILPILLLLAFRFVIPLANTRYLYPLLGIGLIIGFFTADLFKVKRQALNTLVIICGLASLAELAKKEELIISICLSVLVFLILLIFSKSLFILLKFKKNIVFTFCLIVFIIVSLKILEGRYLRDEYSGYYRMQRYSGFWPDTITAWDWLNSNTGGSNIAYTGRPVPFPLYGSGFKNNVFYASVNKTEPAKLHYFPRGNYSWGYEFEALHENLHAQGNYRSNASYPDWLSNLKKRRADFLFVYSLHQTREIIFPIEEDWAALHPDIFKLEFTNNTVRIYRVTR